MTLSQTSDNIVLATKARFKLPYSYTITQQVSDAPNIISTAIMRLGDGSDELDLEQLGVLPQSLQTVLWKKAVRGWYDTDNAPAGVYPTKQFVTYTMALSNSSFSLAVNGHVVRTHMRTGNEPWPTQSLPFKMGPWAGGDALAGWAGEADWKK